MARARGLGLEVALDLALQCSPDHPWVTEHPEWFTTRADGTIAYAENPPKKYQDIYPLNFDNDPEGIYREVLRVVLKWVEHGVTLFRVDNPHTKPVQFWEWLIAAGQRRAPRGHLPGRGVHQAGDDAHPGKVGFHQSYTYFTWRNTKDELTEYLTELSGRVRRLHAAQLLADHARHPHAVHAVRRPAGVQAARRAGRHDGPDVRDLRRVRARRERGAAGRRGADRQREVRVQAPRLGGGGRRTRPASSRG